MRRRIPRHVMARNRNAAEGDANAAFYNQAPRKTGGRCTRMMKNGQVCNQLEDDHFAGQCEDWGPYTPPATEETHA